MADDPYAAIAEPAAGADPYASIAEPANKQQAAPPTPGFFKQLVAPYNPGAENMNPVARALDAAGGALLSTPGAVYHAFADEPTEEEKKKFGEGETQGLKRVGLGVHRLVVDPVASAASDYASGKVTPQAALSVLPEALGTGVGSYAAGELIGRTGEAVKKTPRQFKEGLRPFARRVTDVESGLKSEVTSAAEKQGKVLEENKAKRTETVKENLEKQRAANTDIDRERIATAEKNKSIEAENKAREAEVAKRGVTEQLVDKQSEQLGEKVAQVEDSVRKAADAKFDAVREKIGNPEVNPAPLVDAVKNVETNILQGIPENIKEFRVILGHEEVPGNILDAAEAHGIELGGQEPLTWDKLQSLKSRIDARLRSRVRMNGDLKRGLYSVQDTIVDTMGDVAKGKGADALWNDARNTWRQYKEDFHEPNGPQESGSPVAKILDAVDPKKIRQPLLGSARSSTKNRGIDILRKYPQHGGNEAATLAEQLVRDHDTMTGLPKKAAPKPLKEPKQAHQMPENKPAPAIPPNPTVDAAAVAREAIAKKAKNWASFNARDIGILGSSVLAGTIMHALGSGGAELPVAALSYEGMKYASGRLLNRPAVVEWLSKTPIEEINALKKIPGADKVNIINTLTQQAIQSGKPIRLSPLAADFIGPANAARIMAATGSVSATRVQNRKDALNLLNSPPAP